VTALFRAVDEPQGFVLIEPSVDVVRDALPVSCSSAPRRVELVDGAILVEVPATVDLTLDPSGCTYTVTARLDSYGVAPVVGIIMPTGQTVQVR
jgi:hypothetical protein